MKLKTVIIFFLLGTPVFAAPYAVMQIDATFPKICLPGRCYPPSKSGGSAVVVSTKPGYTYCVTNKHVVTHPNTGTVSQNIHAMFGGRWRPLKLLHVHPTLDIAILVSSDEVRREDVARFGVITKRGSMVGFAYSKTPIKKIPCMLYERGTDILLSNTSISGMSGGALFNDAGLLCGIVYGNQTDIRRGLAVNGKHVKQFLLAKNILQPPKVEIIEGDVPKPPIEKQPVEKPTTKPIIKEKKSTEEKPKRIKKIEETPQKETSKMISATIAGWLGLGTLGTLLMGVGVGAGRWFVKRKIRRIIDKQQFGNVGHYVGAIFQQLSGEEREQQQPQPQMFAPPQQQQFYQPPTYIQQQPLPEQQVVYQQNPQDHGLNRMRQAMRIASDYHKNARPFVKLFEETYSSILTGEGKL